MAAREHQGLQIAVMIFFGLVVLLAITTWLFFSSYDEQLKKVAQLQDQASKEAEASRLIQDEANQYKQMMGFKPEDIVGTVEQEYTKDMEKFAANYPEEQRDYRSLLTLMSNDNRSITNRETAAKEREQGLKDKIVQVEGTKEKQITTYSAEVEKIKKDAAGERNKFGEERDRITKNADAVAAQLGQVREEMTGLVNKSKKDKEKAITELVRTRQINAHLKEERAAALAEDFDTPDGEITWANQHSRLVWVNIGQNDAVTRSTSFSVYGIDNNNVARAEKKGSIEITRVIDEHMSEARIIEDDISDPILPGDKIHSPVWEKGRHDGFALAGFLDIDDDGRSDRDKVRNLIVLSGGKIDAELLDDGTKKGKLNFRTRFLVLGETPTSKADEKLITAYSLLTKRAQDLGVETIPLSKFVSRLGYTPDERTIPLGRGARSADFRAKPPEGVQKKSTGTTYEKFQQRRRPRTTF